MELSRANHHDHDDSNDSIAPRRGEPSTYGKVNYGSQSKVAKNISDEQDQLNKANTAKLSPSSSEDSAQGNVSTMSFDEVKIEMLLDKDILLPESDGESQIQSDDTNTDMDRDPNEKGEEQLRSESSKHVPSGLHASLKAEMGQGQGVIPIGEGSEVQRKNIFSMIKGPFSVRTRQVRGY